MGPKSLIFVVVDGRGAEGGRGTGSVEIALGTGLDESSEKSRFFEPETGDSSKLLGTRSPSKPSSVAKEAKSVSLRGGAGAEGDMVAFSGMLMGRRPDFDEPEEDELRMRVGAVDPPPNRGSLFAADPAASFFPPTLLPILDLPSPDAAAAAVCAAFLFFLSMAILCPGRIWARAHL